MEICMSGRGRGQGKSLIMAHAVCHKQRHVPLVHARPFFFNLLFMAYTLKFCFLSSKCLSLFVMSCNVLTWYLQRLCFLLEKTNTHANNHPDNYFTGSIVLRAMKIPTLYLNSIKKIE
ncbi:hypothetical protein Peur_026888 [Populus x canadensis]